ncbi:TPA: hypothetical protein ACG1TJ_004512 [Salmonella enterica]
MVVIVINSPVTRRHIYAVCAGVCFSVFRTEISVARYIVFTQKKTGEYPLLNSVKAVLMQRYVFLFLRQKQLSGMGFIAQRSIFSKEK